MSDYTTEILSRKDILAAYALVRLAMPGVDLRHWRSFAQAAISGQRHAPAGILVARARQRYICGMLTYRAVPDLYAGRRLDIGHMAALDILRPRAVMLALLQALGELAEALQCRKIHFPVESAVLPEDLAAVLREMAPEVVFAPALNLRFSVV